MSGGGIEVEIGNLNNIFPAGEYPARLEIIIENKIFTPFEDTIILEPNVHVTTKPKAVKEIKESVQVAKVTVKQQAPEKKPEPKKVVEQKTNARKQHKIAMMIAETLKYRPLKKQDPASVINEALMARTTVSKEQHHLLLKMLKAAKQEGVDFNVELL